MDIKKDYKCVKCGKEGKKISKFQELHRKFMGKYRDYYYSTGIFICASKSGCDKRRKKAESKVY